MKCVRCGKALNHPAVTVGHYAYGPKCARQAGLLEPKRRHRHLFSRFVSRQQAEIDLRQLPLF